MKTTELSGFTFNVSATSTIYFQGEILKPYVLNGYEYVVVEGQTIPAHRIVAKAYCEIPEGVSYEDLQVDHIDSDKLNNLSSNLRWVTRKQNNSTAHSRKMKSKNHKSVQHKDEWLKCSDGLLFVNYNDAASFYGVTRQAIINSCRKDRKRHRRQFEWVKRDSVEPSIDKMLRLREVIRKTIVR